MTNIGAERAYRIGSDPPHPSRGIKRRTPFSPEGTNPTSEPVAITVLARLGGTVVRSRSLCSLPRDRGRALPTWRAQRPGLAMRRGWREGQGGLTYDADPGPSDDFPDDLGPLRAIGGLARGHDSVRREVTAE